VLFLLLHFYGIIDLSLFISLSGISAEVNAVENRGWNILSTQASLVSPSCKRGSSFQSRKISAIKQVASVRASFRPTQTRGPCPKERSSCPGAHREGRKEWGFINSRGFRSQDIVSVNKQRTCLKENSLTPKTSKQSREQGDFGTLSPNTHLGRAYRRWAA
jgi:hypothetical protein